MRKSAILLAFGLMLLQGLPAHADIVSYWNFDSKTGTTVEDQIFGSTHAGEMFNGADITTGGLGFGGTGEAFSANADIDAGTKGYMAAGDPMSYEFDMAFTWYAQVKYSDILGTTPIFSRTPGVTAWNQGSKSLFIRGDVLQWDTGWVGNPNTGQNIGDDQWHQLAVTYDPSGDPTRPK